jgi:hypothetical protein
LLTSHLPAGDDGAAEVLSSPLFKWACPSAGAEDADGLGDGLTEGLGVGRALADGCPHPATARINEVSPRPSSLLTPAPFEPRTNEHPALADRDCPSTNARRRETNTCRSDSGYSYKCHRRKPPTPRQPWQPHTDLPELVVAGPAVALEVGLVLPLAMVKLLWHLGSAIPSRRGLETLMRIQPGRCSFQLLEQGRLPR